MFPGLFCLLVSEKRYCQLAPIGGIFGGMGEARKLLASGIDPMAQRATDKITKQASADNSFQSVALLWWDHWHGAKSARHADDVIRRLKADVFPAIGARPVSEIQAHELVAALPLHGWP